MNSSTVLNVVFISLLLVLVFLMNHAGVAGVQQFIAIVLACAVYIALESEYGDHDDE